jgi:hypothetical protein
MTALHYAQNEGERGCDWCVEKVVSSLKQLNS